MKTVKDSCRHTIERVKERYGLLMTPDDYNLLCWSFSENIGIEIINEERTNNQIIFQTIFKDVLIRFVWCIKRKLITTAIPILEVCNDKIQGK